MPKKIKISAITSSRADYNFLYHPLQAIHKDAAFDLNLIVTGSHLTQRYGETIHQIMEDGIPIDEKIDIFDETTGEISTAHFFSKAVSLFSLALKKNKPDLVMVLGDRFEICAAVIAASIINIPIAHLCGGDVTDGALDNAFRHSISKFAHFHFPSTQTSARRLIQLGESPENIFMIGSTGLDWVQSCPLEEASKILKELGVTNPERPFYLVTFHPVTLERDRGLNQSRELLKALTMLAPQQTHNIIFTGVNAGQGGEDLHQAIISFCERNEACFHFLSLGPSRYINLVRSCEAVIGNSSSGFYEAPFLKKPTINIGNRQEGREACRSILTVKADSNEIIKAISNVKDIVVKNMESPYGDGNSTIRLISALKGLILSDQTPIKKFFDIPAGLWVKN